MDFNNNKGFLTPYPVLGMIWLKSSAVIKKKKGRNKVKK